MIDCVASTVEDSKQDLKSVKMKMENKPILERSETIKGVVCTQMTPREGHTQGSDTLSITWIEHEINTLLQKLNWWQKKKKRTEETHTIFFTNNDAVIKFVEDLNNMQSTEFTRPRRRNEFWQTASTPSLRTSLC